MASNRAFLRQLARDLGQIAREVAEPEVRRHSRTLADALVVRATARGAVLMIPHYWAIYVHDGRGPVRARRGTFLIWYRNPEEDPRFRGRQTPQRAAQVRRLSRSEFRRAVELFKSGSNRVVITKGPTRGTRATRFFENDGGMRNFPPRASEQSVVAFREHVLTRLRRELGTPANVSVRPGVPVQLPLQTEVFRVRVR